ncbi:MAG: hypothetical protein HC932_02445 [Thermales bacterium]|nr:hypothetical protein [Thermales bacterium]
MTNKNIFAIISVSCLFVSSSFLLSSNSILSDTIINSLQNNLFAEAQYSPIAFDDTAVTSADTPVIIDVLANDNTGGGAGPLSLNDDDCIILNYLGNVKAFADVVTQPANGLAVRTGTVPNHTITYTPDPGFSGVDTFTYENCDVGSQAFSNIATVTVTVNAAPASDASDGTDTSLTANAGVQTIYAGDATDNDDVCSLSDITNGTTVEGIVCSTAANSLTLPTINIQSVRQNPDATLNDVLVEDLRGNASSNYTVTAEVSDFTTGTATIALGSNPDSASATLDAGTVTSVIVGDNGTSSCTAATVAFSGGTPTTAAEAEVVIAGGTITRINVTEPGSGYDTAPTVTITPTGCSTSPTATAYIIAEGSNQSSGTVNSIAVTDNGTSGCTTVPVAITGGGGTGATAVATVSGGVITEIVVTNPGSGYSTVPTVSLTGHDCTGSTPSATASITADGTAEASVFATLDPSVGDIDRILPDSDITSFNVGPRSLVTNTTTQYTLFNTSAAVEPGRFDIDGSTFGLRVPAFVEAGTYTGTIVQTVIN